MPIELTLFICILYILLGLVYVFFIVRQDNDITIGILFAYIILGAPYLIVHVIISLIESMDYIILKQKNL